MCGTEIAYGSVALLSPLSSLLSSLSSLLSLLSSLLSSPLSGQDRFISPSDLIDRAGNFPPAGERQGREGRREGERERGRGRRN
eukprot:1867613-Rhodomonas_salina.2